MSTCVMSDIRMPGKTGLELLEEIKGLDEDVMVIMISAVKDIESAIAAMSKGAYDYVSKPFKLNEVAFVANKALEKRRLVLENKEYQKQLEKMVEERTSELKQALIELDKTYNFTLRAMVTALDTRDTETQGHSLRVVRFTLKLAELMGISDKNTLKIYEYGALLHDIGKIGIPDAILRKPAELTAAEWQIMKSHPTIGYNVLQRIKFLEDAAQIVLHHHEAFDGSGYPDGLAGENIPLGAQDIQYRRRHRRHDLRPPLQESPVASRTPPASCSSIPASSSTRRSSPSSPRPASISGSPKK